MHTYQVCTSSSVQYVFLFTLKYIKSILILSLCSNKRLSYLSYTLSQLLKTTFPLESKTHTDLKHKLIPVNLLLLVLRHKIVWHQPIICNCPLFQSLLRNLPENNILLLHRDNKWDLIRKIMINGFGWEFLSHID